MKSAYRRLGDYIKEVNIRNSDLTTTNLLGVNIDKFFMPSVANVIGTDMSVYKIVRKGQFASNRMHVGRDYRLPVALSECEETFLVSPAYDVFEVLDTEVLLPEYLMMWFSRAEFDRNAWFYTDADVRGGLHWKAFCDMELPVPDIDIQHEIVKEYHTIVNRIELNEKLNQKLEETAQALYKQWFVDFEFPDENGKCYKSNSGKMIWCERLKREIPEGWASKTIQELTIINYGKTLSEVNRKLGKVKVYSSAGVTGYHNAKLYNEKSIIIGRKGSIGTLYLEDNGCFCIDTAYYIKESDCSVPLLFMYRLLKQLDLTSLNEDSAVPGLSRDTVYQKLVIEPDRKILKKYSDIVFKFHTHSTILKNQLEELNKFHSVILAKMSKPELLETA